MRTTKLDEARAEAKRYADRLRRVEHEVEQLRIRLEAMAWQASRNTPPSIREQKDLWGVAVEAMMERAKFVRELAAGNRS